MIIFKIKTLDIFWRFRILDRRMRKKMHCVSLLNSRLYGFYWRQQWSWTLRSPSCSLTTATGSSNQARFKPTLPEKSWVDRRAKWSIIKLHLKLNLIHTKQILIFGYRHNAIMRLKAWLMLSGISHKINHISGFKLRSTGKGLFIFRSQAI